ncbi:MAG: hypothetical protein M1160_01945 [Candidatus Marsarchaeota archaeon]|jgi:NADH:ubiquinone oxidoreductase subunit 6 (subunit J)|nr:hypothetical protein [Candidatus Marsarchaeota archaeon]MCL5111624.1 hypothetical protein [Candidatus Marsarchaeota archaeon]
MVVIIAVLAALIIIGSLLIFVLKDVLHVAVSLSAVFFINSLIFLFLNQPLLAAIQLLIMIGGVSVYLFVGVAAASYSHFRYTNYAALAVAAIAIFATMAYGLYASGTAAALHSLVQSNQFYTAQIVSSLTSEYTIMALYAITTMLFLIALAAIPLLKELTVK